MSARIGFLPALLMLLSLSLHPLPALAQFGDSAEASLRAVPATLAPGQSGQLVLSVKVVQDFHINSDAPDQPDLIPTKVSVSPPQGITAGKAVFPRPHLLDAAFSQSPVKVFDGEFEIKVPIRVAESAAPGAYKIKLSFSYQACDNQMCLMPVTSEFSTVLQVK